MAPQTTSKILGWRTVTTLTRYLIVSWRISLFRIFVASKIARMGVCSRLAKAIFWYFSSVSGILLYIAVYPSTDDMGPSSAIYSRLNRINGKGDVFFSKELFSGKYDGCTA